MTSIFSSGAALGRGAVNHDMALDQGAWIGGLESRVVLAAAWLGGHSRRDGKGKGMGQQCRRKHLHVGEVA